MYRWARSGLIPFRIRRQWPAPLALAAWLVASPALAEAPPVVPASIFAGQVAGARLRIETCKANASACDAAGLPGREQVQGSPAGTFTIDWDWLRSAFADAKDAKPEDRAGLMTAALNHLATLRTEAGTPAPPTEQAIFLQARTAAKLALARDEFRADMGPTWLQRQAARVQDWILHLFTGMDQLGRRAPWLAPAVEWGCFLLAAAGLLWFIQRSLARQAVHISLGKGAALPLSDRHAPEAWAKLAADQAAAGNWREAVHCLYWAAIGMLEGRRFWKPNATRTPREYLCLLRPGSAAHTALAELTRSFERVWYGSGEVHAATYDAAKRSFETLQAARPDRTDAGVLVAADPPRTLAPAGGAG